MRIFLDPLPTEGGDPTPPPQTPEMPPELAALLNPSTPLVPDGTTTPPAVKPAEVAAPKADAPKVDSTPAKELSLEDTIKQSLEDAKVATPDPAVTPVVPVDPTRKPGTRDFTGIDDVDQVHFKNMSIQAFDRIKPLYLEAKQLKNEVATVKRERDELNTKAQANSAYKTILDHDQGYVLTEEFGKAAGMVDELSYEANHWRAQLTNIIQGEPWVPLYKDPKTGQYSTGDPKKATAGDQAMVTDLLGKANQYHANASQYLNTFQQRYQARRAEINQNMREGSNKFFPFYKDLAANDKHPHHTYYKEAMDMLAPELKPHPLSDMLAKAWTVIKVQHDQLAAAAKRKSVIDDGAKGGPNGDSNIAPGAAPASPKMPTLDDFEKVKLGLA